MNKAVYIDVSLMKTMKERSSISLDTKLLQWLDSMIDEKKIFASRSHGIEFSLKLLSTLSPENIMLLSLKGDTKPIFLSPNVLQKLDSIKESNGFDSREDAIKFVLATSDV
ncbi:hypothetical protein MettiDRAFT_0762 [Methanolobus tindarius DSM 2278]|uniref:Uncharacterized protein n=1 Tax=Methanolobus tindarius DSM 2278 TaxID=1090322 RepID=W9DUI4_METTI|nr:hypothetical protein [Methanolobus tindarius]ETA67342.1 hypothetical protein MettiDRAFT_0762 [Methanolobus tindarius DSM 2278]